MSRRRISWLAAPVALVMLAAVLDAPGAQGDATSDRAEAAAVAQGKKLWRKSWRAGRKACFACHTRGPNKMTGARLADYPKYDKALKKVVNAQMKINQMIDDKSGGEKLELGHDDLVALEAYMKTLR